MVLGHVPTSREKRQQRRTKQLRGRLRQQQQRYNFNRPGLILTNSFDRPCESGRIRHSCSDQEADFKGPSNLALLSGLVVAIAAA